MLSSKDLLLNIQRIQNYATGIFFPPMSLLLKLPAMRPESINLDLPTQFVNNGVYAKREQKSGLVIG
jgi:hypothetical protein